MESAHVQSEDRLDFEFAFGGLAEFGHDGKGNSRCWLFRGADDYLAHRKPAWAQTEANEERREGIRREVMQEVRALFARWLRMQNLVVLTGAGTSISAGGKLGSQLLPGAQKLVDGRNTAALLDRLIACCNGSNPNVEEFLSYLCAVRRCLTRSDSSFRQPFMVRLPDGEGDGKPLALADLDKLMGDLEAAIAVMCSPRLPVKSLADGQGENNPHLAFIGKIVSRDPKLTRARLCTLNYDTLFEQAMDLLHVLYADGFTGRVERHFNPASFDLDYYFPGRVAEGRVRRYDKFLHLYKLHGSVDWRKDDAAPGNIHGVTWCGKALVGEDDVLAGRATLDQVFAGHCAGPDACASDASHVGLGILPTSAKYGETITMPYAHLFRLFAQAVQSPNTVLLVMGYSGWDDHVNRIVEDALANPSFTIVIVDVGLGSWAERMLRSDRCERVYAVLGEWGRFERFAVDVLPDVEQMKTQIDVAKQLRELRASEPKVTAEPGEPDGDEVQ
jgi:hypothetical protein